MTGFRKNSLDLHPSITESSPVPIHTQLFEAIMQELMQRNIVAGTQLPPILSLASSLQLNRDTVRKAYSSLEKEHVIEKQPGGRIYSVTEEFGRSIANRQLVTIGIVIPDRMEELLRPETRPALEVVSGIMDAAADFGIAGMIVPLPEQEDELSRLSGWLERMVDRLDGLIYLGESSGHCHDAAFDVLLSRTQIPQVFVFGESRFREHLGLVQVDLNSGYSGAMEYLRMRGKTKIGAASREIPVRKFFQLQSMTRFEIMKHLTRHSPKQWSIMNTDQDSAKEHFMKVLKEDERPDAIFCADYPVAVDVYQAAKALGINVPEDLEIICYGGVYGDYPFSIITHPFLETGHAAVRMITESRRKKVPVRLLDTLIPTVFRPAIH